MSRNSGPQVEMTSLPPPLSPGTGMPPSVTTGTPVTILVIGEATPDRDTFLRTLQSVLAQKHTDTLRVSLHATSQLPLSDIRSEHPTYNKPPRPRVDCIVALVHMDSLPSFTLFQHSLADPHLIHLDYLTEGRFFLLVYKGDPSMQAVQLDDIQHLTAHYELPSFFLSANANQGELQDAADKILRLSDQAVQGKNRANPLLLRTLQPDFL